MEGSSFISNQEGGVLLLARRGLKAEPCASIGLQGLEGCTTKVEYVSEAFFGD